MTNKFREEYPITSYRLKTALFFILAGQDALGRRGLAVLDSDKEEAKKRKRALEEAIGLAREEAGGMLGREPCRLSESNEVNWRWLDEEDVERFADEEARRMARAVLLFIRHLALRHYATNSYWGGCIGGIDDNCVSDYDDWYTYNPPGMADYVCCICDRLLERLEPGHFY